jgi:hypothetical protein
VRGLQPQITYPCQTVCTRTDLTVAAKHHTLAVQYKNRHTVELTHHCASQTPQQFKLGTNQALNQTNQLLGDCKPDQLLNQTNCQALNWENCVNCQFCGCGIGLRVWLLANNPPYKLVLYTTSSSLMMYCLRLPPSSYNPIPWRLQ